MLLLVRSLYEYAFKAFALKIPSVLTEKEKTNEEISIFLLDLKPLDYTVLVLMNLVHFAIAGGITGTFLYFGINSHERSNT